MTRVEHDQEDARRAGPSRRTVLVAGASGLGAAVLAAAATAATATLPPSPPLRRTAGTTTPETAPDLTTVERVWSQARHTQVELVTILPSRTSARPLPVSLLLHGFHGRARSAAPTGTLTELSGQVTRHAVPAFGLVAVDGGDSYWHENHPADDPMAMLLEEVPQWLRRRGLGGTGGLAGLPFACTGVSMGGFGALLYARRRAERRRPLDALALLAPALMTSWSDMSRRNAFHGPAEWASMDPLLHPGATQAVATGVWCGSEDQFVTGVRRFITETHPAVAYTAHGGHGDTFNRTVVGDVIGFLGEHVPAT
jgi:S-formylglutathione hydrolase FrmB